MELGIENSKHSRTDSDFDSIEKANMSRSSSHEDGDSIQKGKMSRSSSSCSSASSFDPFSDLEDGEKDNSITKSKQDSPSSPESKVVTLPEGSAQTPEWSIVSSSPRVGPEHSPPTPDWSMLSASPKQSPPIQTMGRPLSGYDPSRIPSSIFASKSTSPMEWSVASNESLFSIHMGNNSFSRDNIMFKSGELIRPDELNNLKSNEFNNSPSSLPPVIEVATDYHRKSASSSEEEEDELPKVVAKETGEDRSKEIMPPPAPAPAEGAHCSPSVSNVSDTRTSGSTPRLSDESANSSSSFAFPVLTSEGGTSASLKVASNGMQSNPPDKPESQPNSQPQDPVEAPPKAAGTTSWSSCFSCFPFRC